MNCLHLRRFHPTGVSTFYLSQRDVASIPFYLSVAGLNAVMATDKGQGTMSLVGCRGNALA
ncbi:MAG: hypothetical protein E7349_03020 [Clostridiales bacterium]|nr:hypothetical protein [Clostridiales bacterium]